MGSFCCQATKYFVLLLTIDTHFGLHVKYPVLLSDFNKLWNFSTDFYQYRISRKSVQWEPKCSIRTDGRTRLKTGVSIPSVAHHIVFSRSLMGVRQIQNFSRGYSFLVVKTRDDELGCVSYIGILCMVLCSSNVHITYGPGQSSRYSDSLPAGRSGDRIPLEARFSGPGSHPASYTMCTSCGGDHPPPFSAEVKERVIVHVYSPSGPSWPVLRWPLHFYL
jgi:hypothetical protein